MSLWLACSISFSSHVQWPAFLLNAGGLYYDFPGGAGASAGEVRDLGFSSRVGKIPGRGHSNSLQYSYLENPMDRGAWQVTVHWIAEGWTWLKQLSSMHTWPLLSVWLASIESYSWVQSSMLFWIVYIIIAFVHSLSWSFNHSASIIVCLTYSRRCGRCCRNREEQKDMVSMKGRARFHRDQNLHLEGPLFWKEY